jgi:hypothetical protein
MLSAINMLLGNVPAIIPANQVINRKSKPAKVEDSPEKIERRRMMKSIMRARIKFTRIDVFRLLDPVSEFDDDLWEEMKSKHVFEQTGVYRGKYDVFALTYSDAGQNSCAMGVDKALSCHAMRHKKGMTKKQISKEIGCSMSTVSRVLTGESHKAAYIKFHGTEPAEK